MARPTKYTQKLADDICAELAQGVSLRTVCLSAKMPDASTVFRWLRVNEEFCQQYARAKAESAEAMAEEILDIADDGRNDWVEKERNDGSTYVALDNEHVQRSRLRIDTRKWLMSKMMPKKYGDKQIVAGPDDGPVQITVVRYAKPEGDKPPA